MSEQGNIETRFAHMRETTDRHVISVQERLKPLYMELMEGAESNQDLMEIMAVSSPECLERCQLPDAEDTPVNIFMKKVADIARVKGLPVPTTTAEARKLVCLTEDLGDARFEILKRVPPANIHRMQRGEHWVGDLATGNFVVNALREVGVNLRSGVDFMDYGGSSGSLVRTLAWAFPESNFFLSDPVDSSIDWARENLTFENLTAVHQDQVPPLRLEDNALDVASAISIFSHHGINASINWLAEVARVLRPGGYFLITYNDMGSLYKTMEINKKSHRRYGEIYAAMLENGYAFEEVWLDKDDAGNEATVKEWGNSFFTHAMFHALAAKDFRVAFHGRRLNLNRQDVVILQKK